jgi:hypothetical protein
MNIAPRPQEGPEEQPHTNAQKVAKFRAATAMAISISTTLRIGVGFIELIPDNEGDRAIKIMVGVRIYCAAKADFPRTDRVVSLSMSMPSLVSFEGYAEYSH